MESTNDFKNWLRIRLTIAGTPPSFCLKIGFENTTDEGKTLQFSNRARKAELLCLRVFDENGARIKPERREIILLKNSDPERHFIGPKAVWEYCLEGNFQGACLVFRGAAYKVMTRSRFFLV